MHDIMGSNLFLDAQLRFKCELLCHGINISPILLEKMKTQNRVIKPGRNGGAGPAGGRYVEFSDHSIINTIISTEMRPEFALELIELSPNNEMQIISKNFEIPTQTIKLISSPAFYTAKTVHGIEMKQIGLIHGTNTFATTINQRCMHWQNHQQCQFCAIELSLQNKTTLEQKTSDQIIEVIKSAKTEKPEFANHITLTIGTQKTNDRGLLKYLPILKAIKTQFSDITIHIQIEPLSDLTLLEAAHDAGANTIGIHLEILDDNVRKQICPGKAVIPFLEYVRNWDYALKIFGKNQVDTFILKGYSEDPIMAENRLTTIIQHGIIPNITPVRRISGVTTTNPDPNTIEFYNFILHVASLCVQYGVNPLDNKAGCIRCGGCSPLLDAYLLVLKSVS